MSANAKKSSHYVNNKEFSLAVVEHVKRVKEAEELGNLIPVVPDYIAECFLKISEGLSHKANFIRYTYREEMVMDAVENCLKAITNYNIEAATRTGAPNAFSYFTQICYFAFLRRLAKEKRQQDIKFRYIEQAGVEEFMAYNEDGDFDPTASRAFVDQLRDRIGRVRGQDKAIKEFAKNHKNEDGDDGLDIIDPKGIELFMFDDLINQKDTEIVRKGFNYD